MNSKLFVIGIFAVACGVSFISGAYVWVLPRLSADSATDSVLVLGLVAVALVTGYYASESRAESAPLNWPLILAFSGTSTIVTLVVSLYIMLNLRGS